MTQNNNEYDAQVSSLSYEEARSKLVDIVSTLEQGALPLDDALKHWELGEALARHCQTLLDGARTRLAEHSSADNIADPSTDSGGAS